MRAVLFVIADAANRDGEHAHPGIAAIVDGSLYAKATVYDVLKRLEETGWIVVEEPGGGRGKATVYGIPGVLGVSENRTVSEPKRSNPDDETVQSSSLNGPDSDDRALCLNIETSNGLTSNAHADDERLVFSAWVGSTGKTRSALDAKRRRLIRSRLNDGYTVDDLRLAVTGWQFSPHHRGENDRGTVYNDLGLILRDADHVDAFLEYARTRSGGGRVTSGRDPLSGVREFLADRAETHSFVGEIGNG